ncbi:Prophage P2a protein 25 [Lactiplantibacillus plantarum]|nr:Prophage P2a protein 25 [Lactiplantibacillus plantarum]
MPKHTKKRSTIKRKHRRMKQHAEKAMKSQHDNCQGTN